MHTYVPLVLRALSLRTPFRVVPLVHGLGGMPNGSAGIVLERFG